MRRTTVFAEIATGVGAIGAMVVGVLSLTSGRRLVAAVAFSVLLIILVAIIARIVARNRSRELSRSVEIDVGEYHAVPVDARRGADIRVNVEAAAPIDVWLLDEANFERFEADLEFEPLDGGQAMTSAKLQVIAESSDTLLVVVDNPGYDEDDEDAPPTGVDIAIVVSKSR